jgi:predicted amidohydrolase
LGARIWKAKCVPLGCNQTVMSGGIMDAIIDFAAFSVEIDPVHRVLVRSILVR